MNLSLVCGKKDEHLIAVSQAFEEIQRKAKDIGVPLKEFFEAPDRLVKKGIHFLATFMLPELGKETTIAIRVNGLTPQFRFFHHVEIEQVSSWKGHPVFTITLPYLSTFDQVVLTVKKLLTTITNSLKHLAQRRAEKKNAREGGDKYALRHYKERCRRPFQFQNSHH